MILTSSLASTFVECVRFEAIGKDIISIDKNAFQNLTYLKYINLSGNKLTNIPDGTFDYLNNLEELILDSNSFKTIEAIGNHYLPSLTNLQLNGVEFERIFQLRELNMFPNLKILSMTDNKIKRIDFRSVHKNIEQLFLYGNLIEAINPNQMSFLDKLREINIQRCPIRSLTWLLEMPSLEHLYIGPLDNLNSNVLRNSKNLIRIHFEGVEEVIHDILCSYLANLPSLRVLEFKNSSIYTLELKRKCNATNQITTLNFHHNQFGNNIRNGYFDNFKNLKELFLCENGISHLDRNVFQGAYNLELIDLKWNNLNSTYMDPSYYNFTGFISRPRIYFFDNSTYF